VLSGTGWPTNENKQETFVLEECETISVTRNEGGETFGSYGIIKTYR